MKFDKELRRKISLGLAMTLGFGTLLFWYWIHIRWAEVREDHQRSWPCASYASYPMRDVPLRCLPGAGGESKNDQ